MPVLSKYLDQAIAKYEKFGFTKEALSRGVVSVAVVAYIAHMSIPHLAKLIQNAKLTPTLNDTSTSASDDDDDDDDDLEDTDENLETTSVDHNHENIVGEAIFKDSDREINQNDQYFTNKSDIKNLDNAEHTNCTDGKATKNDSMLLVPRVKRKRKTSRVIKQQIKEAEKLLAAHQDNKRVQASGIDQQHIGINIEFLYKLKRLITIMIPRPWSREIGILCVHTFCLISRTFLSIYVAAIEGAIVKFIVRKDLRQFVFGLMKWFGIAIPATFINSMIRYLENKLALAFR